MWQDSARTFAGSTEWDWTDSLFRTSHAIPLHPRRIALSSFPNIVVQLVARAFSLAVISPFTALRFISGIQCVMYSRVSIREPTYRSHIVGYVKRDYSTRREIVAAVSREPCVVPSNRPDPSLAARAPLLPLLARFFARRSWNRPCRESTERRQFHSEDWWPMARKLTRETTRGRWGIRAITSL